MKTTIEHPGIFQQIYNSDEASAPVSRCRICKMQSPRIRRDHAHALTPPNGQAPQTRPAARRGGAANKELWMMALALSLASCHVYLSIYPFIYPPIHLSTSYLHSTPFTSPLPFPFPFLSLSPSHLFPPSSLADWKSPAASHSRIRKINLNP